MVCIVLFSAMRTAGQSAGRQALGGKTIFDRASSADTSSFEEGLSLE
jgi:hypothetical protein